MYLHDVNQPWLWIHSSIVVDIGFAPSFSNSFNQQHNMSFKISGDTDFSRRHCNSLFAKFSFRCFVAQISFTHFLFSAYLIFFFLKYCTFSDHFGQNLACRNSLNFVFSKSFADPHFLKNPILICFIFHGFLASVAKHKSSILRMHIFISNSSVCNPLGKNFKWSNEFSILPNRLNKERPNNGVGEWVRGSSGRGSHFLG